MSRLCMYSAEEKEKFGVQTVLYADVHTDMNVHESVHVPHHKGTGMTLLEVKPFPLFW